MDSTQARNDSGARGRVADHACVVEHPYAEGVVPDVETVVRRRIQKQGAGVADARDDSERGGVSIRHAGHVKNAYRRAVPHIKIVERRIERQAADIVRQARVNRTHDDTVDGDHSRARVRIDERADCHVRRVRGEELARRPGRGHAVSGAAAAVSASTGRQAEGHDERERRRAPKTVSHWNESKHVFCLLDAPILRGESYNSLSSSRTREDPTRNSAHAVNNARRRTLPPGRSKRPMLGTAWNSGQPQGPR